MGRKGRLSYSLFAKSLAFILLVLSLIVGVGGAIGLAMCAEEGFFDRPFDVIIKERFDEIGFYEGQQILNSYEEVSEQNLIAMYEDTGLRFKISDGEPG